MADPTFLELPDGSKMDVTGASQDQIRTAVRNFLSKSGGAPAPSGPSMSAGPSSGAAFSPTAQMAPGTEQRQGTVGTLPNENAGTKAVMETAPLIALTALQPEAAIPVIGRTLGGRVLATLGNSALRTLGTAAVKSGMATTQAIADKGDVGAAALGGAKEGAVMGALSEAPGLAAKGIVGATRLAKGAVEKLLIGSMSKNDASRNILRQYEGAAYDAIKQKLTAGGPETVPDIDLNKWYKQFQDITRGYKNNPAVKDLVDYVDENVVKMGSGAMPTAMMRADDAVSFQGKFSKEAWSEISSKAKSALPADLLTALEGASNQLRKTVKSALPEDVQPMFETAKAANAARQTTDAGIGLAKQVIGKRLAYTVAGGLGGGFPGAAAGYVAGQAQEAAAPWLFERMMFDPASKDMMVRALRLQNAGQTSAAAQLAEKAARASGALTVLQNYYRESKPQMAPSHTPGQ